MNQRMYRDYQPCWHLLILIWTILYNETQGATFYCSQTERVFNISGETNGIIRTLYDGQSFYDKNLNCDWIVDPGSDPYIRLQVFVLTSDVQWAPEGAICHGYDFMEVRDGQLPDSPLLAVWCGEMNPKSIISTGNKLYIRFASNDREIKKRAGITLNFTTFSVAPPNGGCPSGWDEDLESKTSCYNLKEQKKTWAEAQVSCAKDQSNLVSFDDQKEWEFIESYVRKKIPDEEKVWISLNDISENGQYKWINNIQSSFDIAASWWQRPHTPDIYLDCVSLRAEGGHLQEEFCTEGEVQTVTKYPFICERSKVGANEVFQVPEPTSDRKGQKGKLPPKGVIIAGTIIGFVLLVVLIAVAFFVRKTGCCRWSTGGSTSTVSDTGVDRHTPPPSYAEALKKQPGASRHGKR